MAKDIAQSLAQQVGEVARLLLPEGREQGTHWVVGSTQGERGQSLKICLSGSKVGIWSDFNTGEAGDLLDLWTAVKGISLREAIEECQAHLGITLPKFIGRSQSRFSTPKRPTCQRVKHNEKIWTYLACDRLLSDDALERFKIAAHGEEIIFPYLRCDKLISLKRMALRRPNGKKQIWAEKNCEPCLFGWQALDPLSRTLVLTEGEIDAMTLHDCGLSALSVPFGGGIGGKQQWIETEFDRLSIFDEIFICFDQDDAGQAAAHDVIERLGIHRCKLVTLPENDANDCLKAGMTHDDIKDCVLAGEYVDLASIRSAKLYCGEVKDVLYAQEKQGDGYVTPWLKNVGKLAFRQEELSIWTGINGHGKSQFLGHLMLEHMRQGARVCVGSFEMKPKRLLARMTRQATGLAVPGSEHVDKVHDWFDGKLWVVDETRTVQTDWLIEVFKYAYHRYGTKVFLIDSFMKCGVSEDDYNAQGKFLDDLCDFKNDFDVHIHIVVHPRKGADESHAPGKLDIKGTGKLSDLADNVFSIFRNLSKEKELVSAEKSGELVSRDTQLKPDCFWTCLKQRNGEWLGCTGLYFDRNSFQYLEHQSEGPRIYVTRPSMTEVRHEA